MPYRRKPTYRKKKGTKRPYNMRRRPVMRRKYSGVKYFQERIQLDNIQIPATASTEGGVVTFHYNDLTNADPLAQVFDLFSVVSLTYEIRPINAYSFGSSPTVAPVLSYSIQENPDLFSAPNAKIGVLDTGRSQQRVMDTQRSGVIKAFQKLPQVNYSGLTVTNPGQDNPVTLTTIDNNRNKFKWYSISDMNGSADPNNAIKFGALRWWCELPTGTVPSGDLPLDVAELYITVKYCMKQQN